MLSPLQAAAQLLRSLMPCLVDSPFRLRFPSPNLGASSGGVPLKLLHQGIVVVLEPVVIIFSAGPEQQYSNASEIFRGIAASERFFNRRAKTELLQPKSQSQRIEVEKRILGTTLQRKSENEFKLSRNSN